MSPMFRLFLLCCNLLSTFYPINGQLDPGTRLQIDELIENVYMAENNSPALGLGVVKDGQVYYNTGYGLRDISNGIDANNDTLFFIGSNSKQTKICAGMVPFRTNFVYDNGYFSMAGELAAGQLDNLFAQLDMQTTTYIKVSDDHDNMPNRALGYFLLDGQLEKYNSELYKRTVPMNAAGGILSSMNDMAKYMQFILNNGRVGDVQVVPEEVMKWLQTLSNPLPSSGKLTVVNDKMATELGYSLGLFMGVYDGWLTVYHGGYLTPFNSQMSTFPELNLGIFTVTSGPGRLLPNVSHATLHYDVFDIIQGQRQLKVSPQPQQTNRAGSCIIPFDNWSNVYVRKATTIERKDFATDAGLLQDEEIVGHYGNGQSGEFDVIQKLNGSGDFQLYLSYGQWGQAWLSLLPGEESYNYLLVWDSDIVQEFYATDPSSEIIAVYDRVVRSITFLENGYPTGTYLRDQYLDDLPTTPWEAGSCGQQTI
ncbi:Protein flp [Folsomia candida]|uniref:Protein flp n=1 Tax=Folsomia candida TaxID=158441 RepID=A0A226EJG9_FOLCA|nr:Protein flp [Folsomia candida]